jgi:hypothetical protein
LALFVKGENGKWRMENGKLKKGEGRRLKGIEN